MCMVLSWLICDCLSRVKLSEFVVVFGCGCVFTELLVWSGLVDCVLSGWIWFDVLVCFV